MLIFLFQQQFQLLKTLNIRTIIDLNDPMPSYQIGHATYNLKNINVTGTVYATELIPSIGKKILLDMDSNRLFLQGFLVSHTNPQDSNIATN